MTTRRDFLWMCAVASGAPLTSLDPRSAFAADTPKKGGTLRVGFYIEAATMDPHFSGSKVDRQIYHNIYEPLLVLDTSLGIKPGLAESWQQPDSKTLVMKLRHGVKFHDGTDFNAEAAKFNFNRMKTEPKSVRKGEVASIESVDIVDPYTIKINLRRPDAALLATLTDRAGMMVSPKTAQERGPELERSAKGAGTGPFEFVEWVKDDHLLIKRNDSYWNKQGGPYLDRVRYRPIPDDTVKLQSLQTGEIDVIDYVQTRDVAAVKADRNVVVVDVPSLADFAYQLNLTRPPFATKALRQAVAYSVDLEQIVKGVAQCGRAGQRSDPADELGVRPLHRADQARSGAGEGEAGRGRPAERLHVHDDDQQHPDQRARGRGHPGPAARGRHHDEDQAGRLGDVDRGR
jgi:peptide/nickel transport system substrate-binding protein